MATAEHSRIAARLNRPTRVLGETLRAKGTDVAFYGDARYVGFGGGLPVHVNGAVAGAVATGALAAGNGGARCDGRGAAAGRSAGDRERVNRTRQS